MKAHPITDLAFANSASAPPLARASLWLLKILLVPGDLSITAPSIFPGVLIKVKYWEDKIYWKKVY